MRPIVIHWTVYFNPRSPRGGATKAAVRVVTSLRHFNPRSPRGGATVWLVGNSARDGISIHAPHEGERPVLRAVYSAPLRFQSTLPTRGSDAQNQQRRYHKSISIHAPHVGSDQSGACQKSGMQDFNPRSPRGGATPPSTAMRSAIKISIHAPHEGERRPASCPRPPVP